MTSTHIATTKMSISCGYVRDGSEPPRRSVTTLCGPACEVQALAATIEARRPIYPATAGAPQFLGD
jgi:hypothetical protein